MYIFIAHIMRHHSVFATKRKSTSPYKTKVQERALKTETEESVWERAVAYSSRLRPLLRWRWLLACAFYFSYFASDFQYPSDKSIPLSRSMGARTKRQVSFNSIHTMRKSKAKELNPYYIIDPVTFMPQPMSSYLGRCKICALNFSWMWNMAKNSSWLVNCKSQFVSQPE